MTTTRLGRVARRLLIKARQLVSTKGRRHSLVGAPEIWREKRSFQIRFLKEQGLEPHHSLLDLGCGTLRGGIPIIRHLKSGKYLGVDVREAAIAEGRKEIHDEGLVDRSPQLHVVTNLSDADLNRRFDVIWCFGVMVHMEDAVAAGALRFIHRHLEPTGVCYVNVHVADREDGRWQEFPIVHRPLEHYESLAANAGLTTRDIGSLAGFGHETYDWKRMLELRHASVQTDSSEGLN